MEFYNKKLRVCANCRYLKMLDKGYEFDNIIDSEYIVFECSIQGMTVREDYLMEPVAKETGKKESSSTTCPYWEEYIED